MPRLAALPKLAEAKEQAERMAFLLREENEQLSERIIQLESAAAARKTEV
jgi:hypothetical protein